MRLVKLLVTRPGVASQHRRTHRGHGSVTDPKHPDPTAIQEAMCSILIDEEFLRSFWVASTRNLRSLHVSILEDSGPKLHSRYSCGVRTLKHGCIWTP